MLVVDISWSGVGQQVEATHSIIILHRLQQFLEKDGKKREEKEGRHMGRGERKRQETRVIIHFVLLIFVI